MKEGRDHWWHRLMRELGYDRYAAGGSDFGAGVATYMALEDPSPLIGLHLSTPEVAPYTGPDSRPLSEAEHLYRESLAAWIATEHGYQAIQSTKPQTLGYGLTDSPAGLAAWILEKWRSWSDDFGSIETAAQHLRSQHADTAGFPANSISQVRATIDPTTARYLLTT